MKKIKLKSLEQLKREYNMVWSEYWKSYEHKDWTDCITGGMLSAFGKEIEVTEYIKSQRKYRGIYDGCEWGWCEEWIECGCIWEPINEELFRIE